MNKNIHHEYAECVRSFCQSVPPVLQVSAEEIDTYFRACALYLWAYSAQPNDTYSGINQVYTDRQEKLTPEEFENQLNFYRSNPGEPLHVPDFFHRLLAADRSAGTDHSRRFTEVQKKVLTMCAEYGGTLSLLEGRHMTWLYEQLAALCDQAEIGVDSVQLDNPESGHMWELGELVNEYCRDTSPSCEDQEEEFSDDALYPDPMRRTESPALSAILRKQEDDENPEETDVEDELVSDPLEAALEELDRLTGLDTVKEEVKELVNLVKANVNREKKGLRQEEKNLHLVFVGNPGTGKTTVARIVGKIYKALGVLKKGHTIEVSRINLIAKYRGQTGPKTRKVVDKAMDGVLFIDEAYSLAPKDPGEDFGQEAIAELLKQMEDHRENLAVIVAGSVKEMDRFLQSNVGLRSRFKRQINFEDYTSGQLHEILLRRLGDNDYFLEEPAKELVAEYIQHLYDTREGNFGNAREMQNLAGQLDRKSVV